MSHWLPVSTSADERSYNPCPGCSFNLPALSMKSAIKQCCNSEKCFFNVALSETAGYPTRNAKVFAAYLPITLSTSWSYASSLALIHLTNLSFSDPPDTSSPSTSRINDNDVLPLSFILDSSPPSMTSAWLALDDDEFILESSSLCLPSCFPSALRSEIYAVVLGLNALSYNSSISIYTDCSQLISLWKHFVNAFFSLKLLREPNHLLWLSIRYLIMERNLNVDLIKVPAHGDDIYNIQADSLAKNAHSSLQPTFSPLAFCHAPCLLAFNSLPIDMNIRHFIRSIADACALLSFCSMARFTALGPPTLFDWAGIHFCLSQIKGFASHKNGRPKFWIFRIKLLLDMLPTLTTLQQQNWDYDTPSPSCLWLTRGLLPAHLTAFLKQYFPFSEESQGISAASKLRGPSLNSSSIISFLQIHNSPLATVSQDSWISWISSSIIQDGSWISHLDFLCCLIVQPLRISFW
ncbi:hypothetical protein RhiirC2_799986 [Rhizophagus irregularis]|uniref:RNase H type-1 domain-containing protein n=1 Tax=Rhizophagus irregularis TaxID=588596 RepID=A0A2N1M471_9GLOM|nr:hypothetical protein RhiirC2_799986 [Rhizophagus irregularis]